MRRGVCFILVLVASAMLGSCSRRTIDVARLQVRGDLCYEVNATRPYTGRAVTQPGADQLGLDVGYRAGRLHGPFTLTFDNGQRCAVGQFRDGCPVGDLTRWYRNGVTCVKGAFTDGHPEGVWELWHEGGQPGGKMVYSSGRLNGPVQLLWPDGATRCSAIFVDDLADGELTCAYEGGKPAVQALCKAGLFDGPYTAWHPDGAKLCELSFAAGLPCGSARWFGESGDLVASYDFKPDEGTWYYRDDRLWSYWYFGRSERSRVARAETVRVGLGASCSPFFLVDREESAADLPHGEFIGGLQSLSWTLASSVWAELPGGQPSLSTVRQNGRTEIRLEVAGGTPN